MKTTNGSRRSASNLSVANLQHFDRERVRRFLIEIRRSRLGSRLLASTKLTHHTEPSCLNVAGSSVAKCSATSGE